MTPFIECSRISGSYGEDFELTRANKSKAALFSEQAGGCGHLGSQAKP